MVLPATRSIVRRRAKPVIAPRYAPTRWLYPPYEAEYIKFAAVQPGQALAIPKNMTCAPLAPTGWCAYVTGRRL